MSTLTTQNNEKKQLEFTCPQCGGHNLGEYLVNYETIWVHKDGECEPGPDEYWESDKVRFFCWDCEYTIVDKNNNPIRDHENLVRWIKGEDLLPENSSEDSASIDEDEDDIELDPDMLQFVCPKCGGRQLDSVTVTYTPLGFDEAGTIEFGNVRYDNDEAHFRCHSCRWILADDNGRIDEEKLGSWLEANCDQNGSVAD